jgi:hypothetical protein
MQKYLKNQVYISPLLIILKQENNSFVLCIDWYYQHKTIDAESPSMGEKRNSVLYYFLPKFSIRLVKENWPHIVAYKENGY